MSVGEELTTEEVIPAKSGRYLDKNANVWAKYNDGIFYMIADGKANPFHYGPFTRLYTLTDIKREFGIEVPVAASELSRLSAQRDTAQSQIDKHMQQMAHRVMDVFENAEDDALAFDVMSDVFAAIGLVKAFSVRALGGEA